jgi:hypothetical protein
MKWGFPQSETMKHTFTVLLSAIVLCFSGCRSASEGEVQPPMLPTTTELENMTYQSAFSDSGFVRLVNGAYREQKGDAFGTVLIVTLTDLRLTGFLNPRTEGSVVVLRTSAGPNGTYYDLAAVVKDSAGVCNVALASLGDRIKVTSVVLEKQGIHVQMTVHSPQDLICCPSLKILNTYELRGRKLVLVKSEPVVG